MFEVKFKRHVEPHRRQSLAVEGALLSVYQLLFERNRFDFVEMLVKYRGNIQKLAAEMDVAYNTARSRLDEIVTALGGTPENDGRADRRAILDRLASKEISVEEAMRLMKG